MNDKVHVNLFTVIKMQILFYVSSRQFSTLSVEKSSHIDYWVSLGSVRALMNVSLVI